MPIKGGSSALAGGLTGGSLVAVTQILTVSPLDPCLISAVAIFAITMPFLACSWLREPFDLSDTENMSNSERNRFVFFAFVGAVNLIGYGLIFSHFAWYVGVLFFVSAVLSFCFVYTHSTPRGRLTILIALLLSPLILVVQKARKITAKTSDANP